MIESMMRTQSVIIFITLIHSPFYWQCQFIPILPGKTLFVFVKDTNFRHQEKCLVCFKTMNFERMRVPSYYYIPLPGLDDERKREEDEKKKREEQEKRKKEEEERKFKEKIIKVLPKFWAKRGPPAPTDSGTYNGVFHRTSFKVSDRPTYLTYVGFYGPTTKNEFISADIEITTVPTWKEDWHWYNNFFPSTIKKCKPEKWRTRKGPILVKKDTIFYVKLEPPVLLLPGHWMEIGFCLEGTDPLHGTAVKFGCMKVEGSQERSASMYTDDGGRSFDFLPGSRQMPYLVFFTKDPEDESNYISTSRKQLEELGFVGLDAFEVIE